MVKKKVKKKVKSVKKNNNLLYWILGIIIVVAVVGLVYSFSGERDVRLSGVASSDLADSDFCNDRFGFLGYADSDDWYVGPTLTGVFIQADEEDDCSDETYLDIVEYCFNNNIYDLGPRFESYEVDRDGYAPFELSPWPEQWGSNGYCEIPLIRSPDSWTIVETVQTEDEDD